MILLFQNLQGSNRIALIVYRSSSNAQIAQIWERSQGQAKQTGSRTVNCEGGDGRGARQAGQGREDGEGCGASTERKEEASEQRNKSKRGRPVGSRQASQKPTTILQINTDTGKYVICAITPSLTCLCYGVATHCCCRIMAGSHVRKFLRAVKGDGVQAFMSPQQ